MAANILNPPRLVEVMLASVGHTGDETTLELRNTTDATGLLAHAAMLLTGFRLIGFSEDDRLSMCHSAELSHTVTDVLTGQSIDLDSGKALPKDWISSGSPSFRYAHTQSSMEFVVKVSRLGSKTVVLAIPTEDDKTVQFDFVTKDYLSESFFPYSKASGKELKEAFISDHRLQDLANLFKINIIQKLIPGLSKPGYTETADSTTTRTDRGQEYRPPRRDDDRQPQPEAGVPQPFYDPLRHEPRRPFPAGEQPPGFEDEYEILGPARGYRPNYPGGQNPFSIGDQDLNPPGLGPNPPLRGPFFGEGGIGGPTFPGGGGMHPTPDHPIFGGRGGQYPGNFR